MIEICCDHCGAVAQAPEDVVGRDVRCPQCGETFRVRPVSKPAPSAAADALNQKLQERVRARHAEELAARHARTETSEPEAEVTRGEGESEPTDAATRQTMVYPVSAEVTGAYIVHRWHVSGDVRATGNGTMTVTLDGLEFELDTQAGRRRLAVDWQDIREVAAQLSTSGSVSFGCGRHENEARVTVSPTGGDLTTLQRILDGLPERSRSDAAVEPVGPKEHEVYAVRGMLLILAGVAVFASAFWLPDLIYHPSPGTTPGEIGMAELLPLLVFISGLGLGALLVILGLWSLFRHGRPRGR